MLNKIKQKLNSFYLWTKAKLKYILIAIGILGVCGAHYIPQPIPTDLQLKAPKDKILIHKEVDWIEEIRDKHGNSTGEFINRGKIMKYDYISNKIVGQAKYKGLNEDIEKRKGNAQFFLKEKRGKKEVWEARFYNGTPFIKQNGKWYQTETATTSINAFRKQTKERKFMNLLGFPAYADSTTTYAGASDANLNNYISSFDRWVDMHDEAAGEGVYDSSATENFRIRGKKATLGTDRFKDLGKNGYTFDTSGLPDDATISSATVNIYGYTGTANVLGLLAGERELSLVGFTPNDDSSYVVGDYDQFGAVKYATNFDPGSDFSNWDTTDYNVFTLNATGLNAISKTGNTVLGIRFECDRSDTEPTATNTSDSNSLIYSYFSEQTGTDKDPYLSITYSEASARRIIIIQ